MGLAPGQPHETCIVFFSRNFPTPDADPTNHLCDKKGHAAKIEAYVDRAPALWHLGAKKTVARGKTSNEDARPMLWPCRGTPATAVWRKSNGASEDRAVSTAVRQKRNIGAERSQLCSIIHSSAEQVRIQMQLPSSSQ